MDQHETIYQPRIWKVRVWVKHGPFEGIGFIFKAPYGAAVNAADVLARAASKYQILRYQYGPATRTDLRKLDRSRLERFETAFARVAREWSIDWAA